MRRQENLSPPLLLSSHAWGRSKRSAKVLTSMHVWATTRGSLLDCCGVGLVRSLAKLSSTSLMTGVSKGGLVNLGPYLWITIGCSPGTGMSKKCSAS